MATYTTNLDLKKPAQSDKIRIADINNNMDTIDGAVGDIGERSIAAQIGDVEGALAIVSTGNVHGAITSGQYVYIKNHDTLDDGLYVATTNISANGTLSSSNVTADSAGGGLNALNGKITTDENFLGALIRSQTVTSEVYVLHFYYSVANGYYLVAGTDATDASVVFVQQANEYNDLQCGAVNKWKAGSTLTAIYLKGYSVN